ncbi:MAG: radical SAM family heme chaperone HemW [Chitinophagales bacterium]|nr:radical SAM family heme chaperone HemW [Bacteroidota bacterium]MCB9255979.1 radical SAM family heme chaperone HemW [Chitinophagales bacterium]
MAGIYIHIPFCKQACTYCNFYFSTSSYFKNNFITALAKEIAMQSHYLSEEEIKTVYFGGGTPSILETQELEYLLTELSKHFSFAENLEICLEANPDDLTPLKLKALKQLGINRLSIGIQSFKESDLLFMKRSHTAKEALQCIEQARIEGFDNLSIDLIYGIPEQSNEDWLGNLNRLEGLGINHLSCYALTVEDNTPLYHDIRKGKIKALDEDLAAEHFKILRNWSKSEHWEHYEISNLCKEGNYSRHNTAYWNDEKYLGLGPGAHSYNGKERQWNVPNLKYYIEALKENKLQFEKESLSEANQFNERIMTSIRTMWGIDKNLLKSKFPKYFPYFEKQIAFLDGDSIINTDRHLILSDEGKFYADGIAAKLFIED